MPPLDGPWSEERRHVSATLDEMAATLLRIDHSLNGNGEPGLKTRVARLEDADVRRTWLNRAVITAFIVAMTTVSVAMVKVAAKAAGQQQIQGK